MLAEGLSDFEAGDDALVMRVFVAYFVWSFGPKPLVTPNRQIKFAVRNCLVISLLKLRHELGKSCIRPFVLLKVKLQSVCKCIPAH